MYIAISTIIIFIIIVSAILFYISLKSFYKKDSNSIPVEYLQSMNYLLSEQHDKALDSFMSMVSVSKDTVETHIILGNMFRNRGEVDRAIRIHQNLIARPELEPKLRQECSLELAKDYLKSGLLDRAEIILTKLSNEIEKPVQALNYLKEIYEIEKEWVKVIKVAKRIQSNTNNDLSDQISHYYCELAELELNIMGDDSLEKAIKYVNKALRYNANSLRALILLGDTSFANKNFTDALKKYLAAYEKYPEASYLVLKKIKNTHDNLNNNGSFLDFIKSIAHVNSPIDIFSNIDKNLAQELDSNEIFELYEKEFSNNRVDLSQLSEYLNLIKENKVAFDNRSLNNIKNCIDNYKSKSDIHKCTQCGYKSINHSWQCPSCHKWSSIEKNFSNKSKSNHYVV
jgi:lipopolysaccharide biosynthesis regulator YciM